MANWPPTYKGVEVLRHPDNEHITYFVLISLYVFHAGTKNPRRYITSNYDTSHGAGTGNKKELRQALENSENQSSGTQSMAMCSTDFTSFGIISLAHTNHCSPSG
jgi:hypothetical protein